MTKDDQARIIAEMCEGAKKHMLEHLPQVPEEWDGHELRQWFAEIATQRYAYKMDRKRKREFDNTVLVRNL
jgi:hypothetical protein